MNDERDEDKRYCPLPHNHEWPSKSAPDSPLCLGHIRKVYAVLSDVATFADDADEAEHDAALSASSAPPLSGSREQPLIYSDRLAEHRRDIRGKLASWALLVAEERDVSPPSDPAPKATSAFLRRHHDWSVRQPWVEDYAGEVLELGRRAWSLLNPSGRRTFTSKELRCLEVDDEQVRCTGTLWVTLTPSDTTYEAESEIVCDVCGFVVTADKWLSFGRRVREAA